MKPEVQIVVSVAKILWLVFKWEHISAKGLEDLVRPEAEKLVSAIKAAES